MRPPPRAPDSGHYEVASEAGGKRAATLYTVLESAKLNGLDPEAYLADVIDRMAKGHPINRLGTPAHPYQASSPRRPGLGLSALHHWRKPGAAGRLRRHPRLLCATRSPR